MEADDKWFTKALRTTLIVLFTLQLVSTLERQVFDFLGYMWAPIIGNFFQIIVVILGIFGACNFYRSFIVVYATWNLLWLGWNIFVICLYLEVGILNRDRERYILTIGTESKSWWLEHGIGCEVNQSSWVEVDDGGESVEEGGRRIPPEDSVVGCILQYYYVEVIHAGVQCLLSLGGFVASCICIYSFIEGDDPSKYPLKSSSRAAAKAICSNARPFDIPLLPVQAGGTLRNSSNNGLFDQGLREARDEHNRWNMRFLSVFGKWSGNARCCCGLCVKRRKQRKECRIDSSLFHSPRLSRLRSGLPSLPHIAFPPPSLPCPSQSRPRISMGSVSSCSHSGMRKPLSHPSLLSCSIDWADLSRSCKMPSQTDLMPTGQKCITLTPPARRYVAPMLKIETLMNAFSSSSSSPSPVAAAANCTHSLPFETSSPNRSLHQRQRPMNTISNHNACSSFFSFQVSSDCRCSQTVRESNSEPPRGQNWTADRHEHSAFEGDQYLEQEYKFQDQPRWPEKMPSRDEVDSDCCPRLGRRGYSRIGGMGHSDHEAVWLKGIRGVEHPVAFLDSNRELSCAGYPVGSVEEGEDEVFLSNQEMERMKQERSRHVIHIDSDEEVVWHLQTEL
ncbi:sodium/potassium-transporting ATPase subunit beta-1-interacting protein [Plakobranchus ocellatus]|uniref:Sodium/potassium-transporting ATPase subunit beta-1-interacting protein n=1 Tax=Plakobranchus ocellatus TaxID=259542 RepID=A0AAV4C3W3_9GAST|nr:sodium/potassium-transporting ATPase subunit beta-1-interacting protein [Plakobranchus ocellatus]